GGAENESGAMVVLRIFQRTLLPIRFGDVSAAPDCDVEQNHFAPCAVHGFNLFGGMSFFGEERFFRIASRQRLVYSVNRREPRHLAGETPAVPGSWLVSNYFPLFTTSTQSPGSGVGIWQVRAPTTATAGLFWPVRGFSH